MMKVKTSDLYGAALDWAVAKCDAVGVEYVTGRYSPSSDWAQGGPIIERENLSVSYWGNESKFGQHNKPEQWWEARHPTHRSRSRRTVGFGPTPLIAAMRCYVASKLGDNVDVPDELIA